MVLRIHRPSTNAMPPLPLALAMPKIITRRVLRRRVPRLSSSAQQRQTALQQQQQLVLGSLSRPRLHLVFCPVHIKKDRQELELEHQGVHRRHFDNVQEMCLV